MRREHTHGWMLAGEGKHRPQYRDAKLTEVRASHCGRGMYAVRPAVMAKHAYSQQIGSLAQFAGAAS